MNEELDILTALGASEAIETDIGRMEPMSPEEFEPGDSEEFIAFGPTGHGIMSWLFRVRLKTPDLDFDFSVPCLQALADEEDRTARSDDLATVCKLTVAAARVAESDGLRGRRVRAWSVSADECRWRTEGPDGEILGSGEDWPSFVDALEGLSAPPFEDVSGFLRV